MLKELAPSATAQAAELIEEPTEEQAASFYRAAQANGFAFALDAAGPGNEPESEDELPPAQSLLDLAEAAEKQTSFAVGVCAESGIALQLPA